MDVNGDFSSAIQDHVDTIQKLISNKDAVYDAIQAMQTAFKQGSKVFACGNGGSASDAQHFTSELTGRFEKERLGYPAIALTMDAMAITAIANDYGFERVFARQIESLGKSGDVLFLISTSGNSENLLFAVSQAKKQNIKTIGMLGRDGGELRNQVDCAIIVNSNRTSRIQEAHIFLLHFICQAFEDYEI